MTPVAVGTAQFGLIYGRHQRPPVSRAEATEILALAEQTGCTLDTARAYGSSEELIGSIGTEVEVVTKIRPIREADAAAAVTSSLDESRAALQTPQIGTVLFHSASDLALCGAVGAVRAAIADGRVRQWGVSLSTPAELLEVLTIPDVRQVQLPFNLLDHRWFSPEVQAALAARPEVSIVARSAFLQGILRDPTPATWPRGGQPDALTVRGVLTALSTQLGHSIPALCLGFVQAQPWIDDIVIGVRTAAQLQEAVDQLTTPLSAAELDLIRERVPTGSPQLLDPSTWS